MASWQATSLNSRVEHILLQSRHVNESANQAIGSRFNTWRMPIAKFGQDEASLDRRLRESDCIREYNIEPALWWKSCAVVDEITESFWNQMKHIAEKNYPELSFGKFVKQGSSREGLKIRYPDEFDMILPLHFKGIRIESVPGMDSENKQIPALVKLHVCGRHSDIKTVCPKLCTKGVFDFRGAQCYVNAEILQTEVIVSIMDKTINNIQQDIDEDVQNSRKPCSFLLQKTSVFPPTYRFQIEIQSGTGFDGLSYGRSVFRNLQSHIRNESATTWDDQKQVIEFDIVPGVLISSDQVPNPDSDFGTMTCDRYAVMKWVHKKSRVDEYIHPDLLWRESASGYEKHITDISMRNDSQLYILTSCRIMKSYLDRADTQKGSTLSSYHLKNIAFHCIILLTIPRNEMELSGVKEALGYFIAFLSESFRWRRLPHYMYGNPWLALMFPALESANINGQKLNLYKNISDESLIQAYHSLDTLKRSLSGLFTDVRYLRNQVSIQCFADLCRTC